MTTTTTIWDTDRQLARNRMRNVRALDGMDATAAALQDRKEAVRAAQAECDALLAHARKCDREEQRERVANAVAAAYRSARAEAKADRPNADPTADAYRRAVARGDVKVWGRDRAVVERFNAPGEAGRARS